jgi:hypothetical protein
MAEGTVIPGVLNECTGSGTESVGGNEAVTFDGDQSETYSLTRKVEVDGDTTENLDANHIVDVTAYPQVNQIRLAIAFIYMRKKKTCELVIHEYKQATIAAVIGDSLLLYIESLRMAGTCYLQTEKRLGIQPITPIVHHRLISHS